MALGGVIIACKDGGMCDKLSRTLAAAGIDVLGTATKGASALQKANGCYGGGVLLCSYAMSDMTAFELYGIKPENFEMVVLLSAGQRALCTDGGMLCLNIPINRADLINTVRMLTGQRDAYPVPRPEKRSESDRELIRRAKGLLMERNGMSEPDAHRFMQKQSMNTGRSLVDIAINILNGAG